ncbi:MAG: sugar ABC transporter ATP-binding protein [Phycisphaerales bacterium JB063]
MSHPLLRISGLTKLFPGVRALDGVDLEVRAGEVHALLGENGAGKSTLIKCLTGVMQPDAGKFELEGKAISPGTPQAAQQVGIQTVYQEVNLLPQLSVAENLVLGREPRRGGRFGPIDWAKAKRAAREQLQRVGVEADVTAPVSSLPIGVQQLVAIARAVTRDAKVLVLDEPTSSLDKAEVARLLELMGRLREQGLGIVFVTHFLDQVYKISDRITVLRGGQYVGTWDTASLPQLELVGHMLGRNAEEVRKLANKHPAPPTTAQEQPPVLTTQGIARTGELDPVSLELRPGESLGFAGLLGSGRTELARLLFGADRASAGTITMDGKPTQWSSPREAIGNGIAFVPEERKTEGICPSLSVRENIALALQAKRGWYKPLSRQRQTELADGYIKALGIRTPDGEKPIGQLSGGNQQKAILARWLAMHPRVLILDEPTRGIDIGAKAEIEALIAKRAAEGVAIVFIATELEEVTRDCHRVLVLRDRRVVGELSGDALTVAGVMDVIAGTETPEAHATAEDTPAGAPR